MDFKTYDTGFVTKVGATKIPGKSGYWLNVAGIDQPVPLMFDEPEEWWADRIGREGRVLMLPGVNVRRVDLIPDPSRFLPGFKAREVSTNPETPNTVNYQAQPPQPVILLYEVEMSADTMSQMNALLAHTALKLPTAGYGTTINAFGHSMPFRANSIRNLGWNKPKKDGRMFAWSYTYAVEAWIFSTECVKVPQILQVDLTIEQGATGETNTVIVTESGFTQA